MILAFSFSANKSLIELSVSKRRSSLRLKCRFSITCSDIMSLSLIEHLLEGREWFSYFENLGYLKRLRRWKVHFWEAIFESFWGAQKLKKPAHLKINFFWKLDDETRDHQQSRLDCDVNTHITWQRPYLCSLASYKYWFIVISFLSFITLNWKKKS